jgi:hypothetical protein
MEPAVYLSSLLCSKDRGLVEHFLEPAMYLCKDFYAILESNKAIKGMVKFKLILIRINK